MRPSAGSNSRIRAPNPEAIKDVLRHWHDCSRFNDRYDGSWSKFFRSRHRKMTTLGYLKPVVFWARSRITYRPLNSARIFVPAVRWSGAKPTGIKAANTC